MKKDFTLEQMRRDIAAMIYIDADEIGGDDNLMDLGLDSMRALNLLMIWQERGLNLAFSDLSASPTLNGWWHIAMKTIYGTVEI